MEEENKTADNNLSRKRHLAKFIVVGVVAFAFGFVVSRLNPQIKIGALGGNSFSKMHDLSEYWRVNDLLHQKFDGEINGDKQAEGAIAGMVASLGDPYTTYLSAEQNKELSDDLKGSLSGVGIEVGIKNDKLSVIAPIDDAPAAKAGIKAGDIIVAVNGEETSSMSLDMAVSKIRGKKGSEVTLTIVRGSSSPKEYKITRDEITVASVKTEMKEGGIGYIKISRFGDDTVEAVQSATKSLTSNGARVVIIDLRDNPGGYLDGAVDVTSQFLAKGVIVEQRSSKEKGTTYRAKPGGNMTEVPVVLLVNGGSASAAEIMAGALRDNNRATLVGEKTFGKGSVQQLFGLSGGSAVKITVAHWYTQKGVNITKDGIKPDIEVKQTTEDYNAGRDPQLDKAIEVAKSKAP